MEQDKPKISVIVPVYNVEAFVEKCLVSLAVQTYPNMEVIMVDDASTDSGGDICDDFAARDSRFLALHLPKNCGLSAARNKGVCQASGKYITFVDSDDYVEPGMLETLYCALTETQADVSICGNDGLRLKNGPSQVYFREEAVCCLARRRPFLWTAWGKLYLAEMVKGIPFDERALCCEDLLFFYQILKKAGRIAYVPDGLYHYVYREGSLINNGVTEKRCVVLSVLDYICRDAARRFPEAETGFRQVALETTARLAMQAVEEGTPEGSLQDYLKRFRDYSRRHFNRKALALCPDKKSAAAELALCAGVWAFWTLAVVYKKIKSTGKGRKKRME